MGFGFAETMSGTWTRDGVEQPFSFTVTVRSGPLLRYLLRQRARMEGTVDAGGLAGGRALRGTLLMRPFLGRCIRYEFEFAGDDGRTYRFAGQKDIRWTEPLRTWTELPGEILDEAGRVVGRARTRFDLRRDGVRFLRSWLPA
ncbi:MAG: hypothetical protein HS111_06545 [Kofleriaceae bacterium]|nr:hypothetical protein [Kofleriaceae bacterium]MCL4223837.1 hypothetical protein [Myxococcales bacterium]